MVINGIIIAAAAVILVLGRILWPKEFFQSRKYGKQRDAAIVAMKYGLALLEDEQYEPAIKQFQYAAQQTPDTPAPALLRIYALGLQGYQSEARAELQSALLKWNAEDLPKRILAMAYLGAAKYDLAYETAFAAASGSNAVANSFKTLGDVCRISQRFPEAERAYQTAQAMQLEIPLTGLAYVLAAQGRIAEAEAILAAQNPRVLRLFESQLTLAFVHTQARRYSEAIEMYMAMLQQTPQSPRIIAPYGEALLDYGQVKEAYALLKQSVFASPDNPFLHTVFARACLEQNEAADAAYHVRLAIQIWPGFGAAQSVYGDIMKKNGRYEAAEEHYRKALELNPFLADTYEKLAALLRLRASFQEAAELEREAKRLRPDKPLRVTQETLAITTNNIATNKMPYILPQVKPEPEFNNDVIKIMAPTFRKLPMRLPEQPSIEPKSESVDAELSARSFSDIKVIPGAALLFDQSTSSFVTQTFQIRKPIDEVKEYYLKNMANDFWELKISSESIIQELQGETLEFAKIDSRALITIGIAVKETKEYKEHITYIITHVSRHD